MTWVEDTGFAPTKHFLEKCSQRCDHRTPLSQFNIDIRVDIKHFHVGVTVRLIKTKTGPRYRKVDPLIYLQVNEFSENVCLRKTLHYTVEKTRVTKITETLNPR